MKKSKHFRKDVIIARIIFAVLCIVIVVLLWLGVSALIKPQGNYADDPQNNQQESQDTENQDSESEYEPAPSESESEPVSSESESTSENEPEDTVVYVVTNTEVRLRQEANTECETLARIPAGTQLVLLEELSGWYKVVYEGREGYVSAEFATVNR